MTEDYPAFLLRKAQANAAHGFDPVHMPGHLFPFQQDLTGWAVRMGRCAIFADCGLGKTPMQMAWACNVAMKTGRPVLIVTPLAVSFQTEREAAKFGYDAAVSRDGTVKSWIVITNYERLEKFRPEDFGGAVCDESSAIKAFDGKRKAIVTEFMRTLEYRLLCTATAAPNDYIELGTSSEALGYLGYTDMLTRFFTNKEKTIKSMGGRWRPAQGQMFRFKGHAEEAFWQWVASWARAIRRPSDFGYDDDGFLLPPLDHRQHTVDVPGQGGLPPVRGLAEERAELRATVTERCEEAARVLEDADRAVAWCYLNDEGRLLTEMIDGAVEISGSTRMEVKEERLRAFSDGEIRVLVTKPLVTGWGLNWQHCSRMTFFPSHSYEQYYQAVRRCWRFGQQRPVIVDIITTPGGKNALVNLRRKAAQADAMFDALLAHMNRAIAISRDTGYDQRAEAPSWGLT